MVSQFFIMLPLKELSKKISFCHFSFLYVQLQFLQNNKIECDAIYEKSHETMDGVL